MDHDELNLGPKATGICRVCGNSFDYELAKNGRKRKICSEACWKEYNRKKSQESRDSKPKTKPATDCVFEAFQPAPEPDEINMKKIKNLDNLMDEFKLRGMPASEYAEWQKKRTLSKVVPILIPQGGKK